MSILGKSSILRDPTSTSTSTFKELEDTPNSYEDQANKVLLVKTWTDTKANWETKTQFCF